MRRRATISALLLVGVGVILGMTVFRADIAQATGLAQSVTVNNTASNPVPVDVTNATVPVHEQGTANVNVTNSSLSVAPQTPVTAGSQSIGLGCPQIASVGAVTATGLAIHTASTVDWVALKSPDGTAAQFYGPGQGGNADIVLSLPRPIQFSQVQCTGTGQVTVGTVGNSP
jgi:hypothetical protein